MAAARSPPPHTDTPAPHRESPRLKTKNMSAYALPVCEDAIYNEMLSAAGHGTPSNCVARRAYAETSRLTAEDYGKLKATSWQSSVYIIKDNYSVESITMDGLIRVDQLIISVAHALQPTNKAAGGTKASRYSAVGDRVIEILDSLRFTLWCGLAHLKHSNADLDLFWPCRYQIEVAKSYQIGTKQDHA